MVKDGILKPCANAFLTPIYPAYSPKNFIFALRRSVSKLVLGGQSTTKFFFQLFSNVNFSFLGEIFIYFFLSKLLISNTFPEISMPFCHSSPFFGQNRIFGRFHLIFGSTVLHFVYVLRSSQKDSKFFKLGQMKYHENLKTPH